MPDGVREHFQDGIGRARATVFTKTGATLFRCLPQQVPRSCRPDRPHAEARASRRLGCGPSGFPADAKGLATRDSSGKVLNAIAPHYPWLIGGSADLAPSTKTRLTFEGAGDLEADTPGGRNLHFGVREHAMGAILNGLALSKLRAYGSGFLIFSDYMKPPIRLAALMELPVIYVFTHDSIGVGEDGPTHQPVEQLVALRAIPGLITLRPADANEVAEAWRVIIGLQHQPACLVLSRQALPTFDRARYAPAAGVAAAPMFSPTPRTASPTVILIGTGSEVALCIEAYEELKRAGHSGARRQHAVVGAVRAAGPSVSRWRSSAGRHRARLGRDGLGDRLGSLCRHDGRQDRHAHVRRFGAAQGPARQIRLHAGQSACRREGADRKVQRRRHDERASQSEVICEPAQSACTIMGRRSGSTFSPGDSSPRAASRS